MPQRLAAGSGVEASSRTRYTREFVSQRVPIRDQQAETNPHRTSPDKLGNLRLAV